MAAQDEDATRRPSVLDPDEYWYMPERLYVAVRPDGKTGGPMLELYELGERGQHAVLGYSSLERFVMACGADQPWMLMPAQRLAELARNDGGVAFSVLLDKPLPSELRGTAAGLASRESSWADGESADWAAVYIPSRPFGHGDTQAKLELQPMPGDRLALMVYTSQQALVAGCGPAQPWVSIPAGLVSEARQQSGAHTVCLDTPLPERLRHGSEGA